MRGSVSTQNRRYSTFTLTFEPNTLGRSQGMQGDETSKRAYGWKDALNQAEHAFDLVEVRFINHPSNEGVAVVYDEDGEIVGQVTATKFRS